MFTGGDLYAANDALKITLPPLKKKKTKLLREFHYIVEFFNSCIFSLNSRKFDNIFKHRRRNSQFPPYQKIIKQ